MTDKRIKSFLEDRLKRLESIRNEREWTTAELGDIACCKQTLVFIDTLEVKEVQEETVSRDLEEMLEYVKYQLYLRLPEILDYNGVKVEREDFINDFIKAIKED